jgi:hypothetical protein
MMLQLLQLCAGLMAFVYSMLYFANMLTPLVVTENKIAGMLCLVISLQFLQLSSSKSNL